MFNYSSILQKVHLVLFIKDFHLLCKFFPSLISVEILKLFIIQIQSFLICEARESSRKNYRGEMVKLNYTKIQTIVLLT